MENYILIGSILLIHIFRWLTPGPQFALIIRNSLMYSRKTGFWTAVGFAIGNLINIFLSVTGIALIITKSPFAHNAIKYLGAGYLIYLGFKTFLVKIKFKNLKTEEKHHNISPLTATKIGLITNLLNPNAPLFFISIFGGLITSNAPNWVISFLMIAMPLNSLFMASLWTVLFTQKTIKGLYMKFEPTINKFLGIALILLGLVMLFRK